MEIRPERIFALIVGIDHYPDAADWLPSVCGPVDDAVRLYTHLVKDRQVPPANIKMFLSPLGAPPAFAGLSPAQLPVLPTLRASATEIRRWLMGWPQNWAGDLLLVYWAGHGAIEKEDVRRLFCDDGYSGWLENINFETMLGYLRSSVKVNFPCQIVITDACAFLLPSFQTSEIAPGHIPVLNGQERQQGQPLPEQCVLMSSRRGELAQVDTYMRRCVFTTELLKQWGDLNTYPTAQLWDKMPVLWEALKAEFDKPSAQNAGLARPSRFLWKGHDGSEEHFALSRATLSPADVGSMVLQCDRSEALDSLEMAYQTWQGKDIGFFMLPSVAEEWPLEFVARAAQWELARFEKTYARLRPFWSEEPPPPVGAEFRFTPAPPRIANFDAYVNQLLQRLKNAVKQTSESQENTGASSSHLWNFTYVKLTYTDWKRDRKSVQTALEGFVQACLLYAADKTTPRLLVFFVLEHNYIAERERSSSYVQPDFRPLLRMVESTLRKANSASLPLPELQCVRKSDVGSWLRRSLAPFRFPLGTYDQLLKRVFDTANERPMGEIGPEFEAAITALLRTQQVFAAGGN